MEKPLVFCMVPCCLLPDWEYLVISDFWKKKPADLRIKTRDNDCLSTVGRLIFLEISISSISSSPIGYIVVHRHSCLPPHTLFPTSSSLSSSSTRTNLCLSRACQITRNSQTNKLSDIFRKAYKSKLHRKF